MDDLISRQAAIDAHCELCGDKGKCNCDICPDVEVFQLLPSAQPSEEEIFKMQKLESAQIEKAYEVGFKEGQREARKKGKWIFDEKDYQTKCSKCGCHPWFGVIPTTEEATKKLPHCPVCLADMRNDADEQV